MELSHDQPIFYRPSMHHVDGGLARARIVGAARSCHPAADLAFVGQLRHQRLHPTVKQSWKCQGKYGQTRTEGICEGMPLKAKNVLSQSVLARPTSAIATQLSAPQIEFMRISIKRCARAVTRVGDIGQATLKTMRSMKKHSDKREMGGPFSIERPKVT